MKKRFNLLLPVFFAGLHLYKAPPPPPGGGGGPTTPGAPASPIDMYIIVLISLAIILTLYFAKNYKKQSV